MRPHPGRQMQEEHSRARRMIEKIFGLMVASWKILHTPITSSVENIEKFVMAIVVLHNYLRLTENASYSLAGFGDSKNSNRKMIPGNWSSSERNKTKPFLNNLPPVLGLRYQQGVLDMRNSTKDYVNSPICKLE